MVGSKVDPALHPAKINQMSTRIYTKLQRQLNPIHKKGVQSLFFAINTTHKQTSEQ